MKETKQRKRHAGDWTHNGLVTGMFPPLVCIRGGEKRHGRTKTKDSKQADQLNGWMIKFSTHDSLVGSSGEVTGKKTRVHCRLDCSLLNKSTLIFFCFG